MPDTTTAPAASSEYDDIWHAFFRLRRMLNRHAVAQRAMQAVELSRIFVAQAVEVGAERPDQEMTVGVVAERLDVDPSTASRLVADTVRAGYLSQSLSPSDGRRTLLALTDTGRVLLADVRQYQRDVLTQYTADWSDEERREFARLLTKFADAATRRST